MKVKKGSGDLKIEQTSSFQKVYVLNKLGTPKKYLI